MVAYDFFISYKWNKYCAEASRLKAIAEGRGFSAWIDAEHPFKMSQDGLYEQDEALARHLREAMGASRFVLFFETTATMAMVIGGPPIRVTTWQERELGMAASEKLVTLYHGSSPRKLGFGTSPKLHDYDELRDAFTMVETAIKDPARRLWKE